MSSAPLDRLFRELTDPCFSLRSFLGVQQQASASVVPAGMFLVIEQAWASIEPVARAISPSFQTHITS